MLGGCGAEAEVEGVLRDRSITTWSRLLGWRGRHKSMDAVKRLVGDAAAIAQPCGKLAVINGAPPEGGLGKSPSRGNSQKCPAAIDDRSWPFLTKHSSHPARSRPCRWCTVCGL